MTQQPAVHNPRTQTQRRRNMMTLNELIRVVQTAGAVDAASESHSVNSWATTNAALDALGAKINEIITALEDTA